MPLLLKGILLSTVIVAAVFDLRCRRIPNWLNLAALVLGIGGNILLFHLPGLLQSSLGLGCALLIYVPLYLVRGMGAGDVKLMAAIGSIVGPGNWLGIFLATALLGGLVSLIYIASRRRLSQTFLNLAFVVAELGHLRVPAAQDVRVDVRHPSALRMPHGAVIAGATGVFLLIGSHALNPLF
jgi:prepilin peptidase CpaA